MGLDSLPEVKKEPALASDEKFRGAGTPFFPDPGKILPNLIAARANGRGDAGKDSLWPGTEGLFASPQSLEDNPTQEASPGGVTEGKCRRGFIVKQDKGTIGAEKQEHRAVGFCYQGIDAGKNAGGVCGSAATHRRI